MKKTSFILTITFIVVMFFTLTAKSQSMADDDLKMKIEKINKEMATAMLKGDMEKSLSYYTKDVISLPNMGKMLEGIDAIKKSNEEMMKSGMKVTAFETKTLKVKKCESMITEIGTYKITLTMPGTEKPIEDHGKYLTVWEKQSDGSLKVKLEMWNTDINPMETEHKM